MRKESVTVVVLAVARRAMCGNGGAVAPAGRRPGIFLPNSTCTIEELPALNGGDGASRGNGGVRALDDTTKRVSGVLDVGVAGGIPEVERASGTIVGRGYCVVTWVQEWVDARVFSLNESETRQGRRLS